MNKEKNFVSAVIYVHNVENKIGGFLATVIDVLQENFEHSEIICVNDCSDDGSRDAIQSVGIMAKTTSVSIVNMSYFHGLEKAMDAGMDLAIGDFVFEFDKIEQDFSPEMVMRIYRHALTGYDIVSASPKRKEKLTSRLFYRVFDKFSEVPYTMTTESFRVLSRRVINRISSMNITIPYRKAVYAISGMKTDNLKYDTVETPRENIDIKERKYRTGLAVDSLILFTSLGYRFSLGMTSFMMLLSFFMIIYTVVVYLIGHPIEGWTTTVLFLSVAFLGLFGILTIIVKYLQIIVNMIFRRKHYTFESIEKITK